MGVAPIIIIGSGLAGYTLAREFRKLDAAIPLTLITADDGAFYSKPLLSNALTQGKTAAALATSNADAMAQQLHADIFPHSHVTQVDPLNKLVITNTSHLPYQKLIFAVGAHQTLPPLDGDGVPDILTVNDLADYALFRDKLEGAHKVTIIGAGFIGCEFANDLANKNIPVNIISQGAEPFDHLLPREIGQSLRLALETKNTTWHLNCSARAVHRSDTGLEIQLSNGDIVDSQLVLSATGLKPNTKLARSTGLRTQRGIITNHFLETNINDIYALGDCLELDEKVLPFVMPLMCQARALAKTLAGNRTAVNYPVMPLVVKTPAMPINAVIPPTAIAGQWKIEASSAHGVKALYVDETGTLLGYALCGDAIKEKTSLIKMLGNAD